MTTQTPVDKELLNLAINAVKDETGLQLNVQKLEAKIEDKTIDALIKIKGLKEPLAAEIKKWAQHKNLGAVINQVQALPIKGLLVADYVNPVMAEKLKKQKIQFIDTYGNAFINMPPIYIFVKGNREPKNIILGGIKTKPQIRTHRARVELKTTRAFQPTGLKVGYAFLCNPELINAPYRKIAEIADVAIGTVGWVITDLKEAGIILDKGKRRGRKFINYKKFLDRWVENYPVKLRPKLTIGEYRTKNQTWWKKIDITKFNAYWGGEIAAAKYTKILKPEIAMLYIKKEMTPDLFAKAKLQKLQVDTNMDLFDTKANVLLFEPFWLEPFLDDKFKYDGYVNPVLAYADLIATGDPRNFEAANKIYEEFIAKYIGEN